MFFMKLYNSLTQTKELFIPIHQKKVTMYVCGITPYDTTHLGHAFTYISFDILNRYLAYKGYSVNYTQNVTDIDDDILRKAKEAKRDWKELGTFWTNKFLTDLKTLNIQMPTYYVKATENIPTIIEIITHLLEKEFAYQKEGNVYFRVRKALDYGKLSRYNREQMLLLSKERGANPDDPLKENPLDFILWQKRSEAAKRTSGVLSEAEGSTEPAWDSPWSGGRPGWHIECSAMAYKYLDKNIDIHGGGRDLIYPHHESEIAQSENFTGIKPFAKYWLHTGAVMYQGEKMSKSLGNLVMVSDLLKEYSPNTIRHLLLSHHYRTPWEFHEDELKEAEEKIEVIKRALGTEISIPNQKKLAEHESAFKIAMDDDMNTPKAIILLNRLATSIIKGESTNVRSLQALLTVLGYK
jgi:L-cysteine:1D-myo-inositol 2-amino-2-deoxy-alpha-D-glucopyranoside ligase